MPALPAVPKVIKCILVQSLNDDLRVLNILHFRYATALSQADSDTFAGLIGTQWSTHILPLLTSASILQNVETVDLTSATAPVSNVLIANPGLVGTESCPAGSAMVISNQIARRYRGGHPRTYLAGLPVNTLTNAQEWGATIKSNVKTGFDAFANAVISGAPAGMGAVDQVNVSYFQGFTPFQYPSGRYRNIPKLRVGGPVVDEVIHHAINPKMASQRRRNTQSV
jgi:hypothetical protein